MKGRMLLVLVMLPVMAAFAQTGRGGHRYELPVVFRHLNTANGLAGNVVSCILQDRRGFMWFGTDKGLNRFDGKTFLRFTHNPEDTNSLGGNNITALYEDRRGRLWVGTNDNGVTVYDPVTDRYTRYQHDDRKKNSINPGYVSQIYEDREGRFWICLYGGGLDQLDEKHRSFIHHVWKEGDPFSIAGIKAKSIYELSPGKFLVGTFEAGGNVNADLRSSGFINEYDIRTNRFQPFETGDTGIHNFSHQDISKLKRLVHTIVPDSTGNIWFGTYCGILRYSLAAKKSIAFIHSNANTSSLSNDIVRAICVSDDKIYFGTEGGGLNILDTATGRFTCYKNDPSDPNSLSDDFIRFIYRDGEKRIWIGTAGGGINIIDPPKQEFIIYPYSFLKIAPNVKSEDVTISAICPTGNGKVLLGSHTGLTLLDTRSNEVQLLQRSPVVSGNKELSIAGAICPSATGDYWVGIAARLYRYHPYTQVLSRYYGSPDQYWTSNRYITAIAERDDSSLLINQYGMFTRIIHSKNRDTIMQRIKEQIAKDREGNVWCSQYTYQCDDSILRIGRDGQMKVYGLPYRKENSITVGRIRSVYADHQNRIWVSTDKGLFRLHPGAGQFAAIRHIPNFPDSTIITMTDDGDNNMWFLTSDALIRMDREQQVTIYEAYKDLPVHKPERRIVYDPAEEAIYFAANEGLVKFYPQQLNRKRAIPPVFITAFKLFGKPLQADSSVLVKKKYDLRYDQNFITISFEAINYAENVAYDYTYKLEGLNNNWIDIGDKYEANFTNLPSGTYIFKARASTKDGAYVSESQPIVITIATPWWKTFWFYFGCVAVLVLAASGYTMYRTKALRRQKRKLEEEVAERTRQYKEQKEKAEKGERLRQQFLANMSHEIRTPMNAVNGMIRLLLESDPKPEQVPYLEAITQSSDLLLHIINDVLDISRMEAGRLQIEKSNCSVREIIARVAEMLQHSAVEKGICLQTMIDDAIPGMVIGDPYRISQVLLNLCGNAIKFTGHGMVTIAAEMDADNAMIRFRISDTGIGIPLEKLDILFVDFAQVNISDTRIHGGTGLGLSICKGLVTLMGGTITATSMPGQGSVFTFTIPCEPVRAEIQLETRAQQPVDGSILNGLSILIADDNEYNRKVLEDVLRRKADVATTVAINGEEALSLLSAHDYDLILMDAQMPVMSGIDATIRIRSDFHAPKNGIPIIAMTASVLPENIEQCLLAGMNAVIPKPFTVDELVRTIAVHTGRTTVFPDTDEKANRWFGGQVLTDLHYLSTFCEGDIERMKQYITLYIQSVPLFIDKLRSVLQEGDRETANELIHAFKPKWAMMGMNAACDIATQLENGIPDDADWKACIHRLLEDTEGSVTELKVFLNKPD